MLGSLAWSLGQAAEIFITQARLINYAEIWGNWGLAQNFIFAFNVTQTLNDGVMPAISEAISNGKRILSQYYTVMTYKYNGIMSAFIGAVLLAVAPRFIIGSTGVEFQRAAIYVIPLTIWGAVQFPSWVGDNVQLGSNKPYLKSLLIFSEQTIRVSACFPKGSLPTSLITKFVFRNASTSGNRWWHPYWPEQLIMECYG
jgi:O-antigen/teichoic acid export membrane protein